MGAVVGRGFRQLASQRGVTEVWFAVAKMDDEIEDSSGKKGDERMKFEGVESSEGDEFSGSDEEDQTEPMDEVEGEDLAHQVKGSQLYMPTFLLCTYISMLCTYDFAPMIAIKNVEIVTCLQVKEFFLELDIDETKQKKRLFEFGFRVPRRKSILPHHLHSVMGSANLRLAHRDTDGALKLCKEIIRQGINVFLTMTRSQIKRNTCIQSLSSLVLCVQLMH